MGGGERSREWGKRAWQDKSCIFIILFYCAYIFKYVFLPCSADLFLFPHLLCHLVAKDAARGQGRWRVLDVAWWVIPRN